MSTINDRAPLTRHFTDQHLWIQRAVRLLARATAHLRTGAMLDLPLMRQFVHFFETFADQHHREEESFLFPWLRRRGVEAPGLAGLCTEHDESRELLRDLTGQLDALDEDPTDLEARDAMLDVAERYAALISEHDWKEDHILYPMAEFLDTEDELSLLESQGFRSCLEDAEEPCRWIESVEALALAWPMETIELHFDPPMSEDGLPVPGGVLVEEDR